MSRNAVNDLIDQYQRSFKMLSMEIRRFDDQEWLKGLVFFQVPVKIAMHIVDCLDYYFSDKDGDHYKWGYRFGGGYWELLDERLPDRENLLVYSKEIENRVITELSSLNDEDLFSPVKIKDGSGETQIGHYIYALRHTMHHHGELATLNVFLGNEGGVWE